MTRLAIVFISVTGLLLSGCSDRSRKTPKIRKKIGVATRIDLKNNSVAMTWKDDKGNEYPLEGTIRETTEVTINGRDQKLEDVRVGDKVTVWGFKEGKGADEKLVATKIEVERTRDSDWKTASQPAAPVQPGSSKP
jgi:hypothetical protein